MEPLPIKPRRKRKLDPKVIRAGDQVRILNPRFVVRVGYPKVVKDYYAEVEKEFGDHIDRFLGLSHSRPFRGWGDGPDQPADRSRIIRTLAYSKAKQDGFGGKSRSIHLAYDPAFAQQIATVSSVRTAMTGMYGGPYEPEYGSGGLADMKPVRIIEVHGLKGASNFPLALKRGRGLEFPLSHVEKITDENRNQTVSNPLNNNLTSPEEELRILKEAYEYWKTDGTDEEAQESGARDAEEMCQWVLESLREKGYDPTEEDEDE